MTRVATATSRPSRLRHAPARRRNILIWQGLLKGRDLTPGRGSRRMKVANKQQNQQGGRQPDGDRQQEQQGGQNRQPGSEQRPDQDRNKSPQQR